MSRQQEATPGDQAVSASVREESTNVAKESFVAKDVHQDDSKVLYSCIDAEDEPYKYALMCAPTYA
ncbi:hypothetical protein BBBOND_0403870 [Babesia bigemina]|uniref:Uncharacterized protein n=1 Tax=Babesia bigemina TaxID=5866 RepID=A0A061DE23_BABBI|nr:hypothetical protein BBBOND_0403870 [Babesia bigemina]CDR97899.1 hypothetical protein BBBOND_0403870 [Babesia bigemina]|eukprot:XP_012770085.1 hypothetical protein BBBOND_0403870 [Babesia bigemina]